MKRTLERLKQYRYLIEDYFFFKKLERKGKKFDWNKLYKPATFGWVTIDEQKHKEEKKLAQEKQSQKSITTETIKD